MTHPEIPSIGVCFSWWSRGSGRNWEGYGSLSVFHHILLVNLINIEDGLGGGFELNSEVNIVPPIFSLPELFVGHDVRIKIRNINNILKLEKLFIYKYININLNFVIALYI